MGTTRNSLLFAARASIVALSLGIMATWMIPASAGTSSPKPISGSINPSSAPVGTQSAFTLTITNGSTQQQIGSIDITVPAAPTTVSASQGTLTWSTSSTLVSLRTVGLQPMTSMTVSVTLTIPCSAGATSAWSIKAKQSNDFNGPPGNNFTPYPLTLTTSNTGTCHLAFTAQPADAEANATITSVAGDPTGTPVAVEVLNGADAVIDPSSLSISLAIGSNPGGGSLSGGAAKAAPHGVATFPDLSIDAVGSGYTLIASAGTGVTPATSDAFNIVDVYCAPNTVCQGGDTSGKTSIDVSAPIGNDGGYMTFAFGGDMTCAGYAATTSVVTFNVVGGSDYKTVTLRADKALVQQSPNNGTSFYQVCFSGSTSFVDRFGNTVAAGDAGLLPDCVGTSNIPCVVSRNKNKSGDVLVTFLAPAGDPRGYL